MKLFHCDACREIVYFENFQCLKCGADLAFLPDLMEVGSLKPGSGEPRTAVNPNADPNGYRLCLNQRQHAVCNEAIPVDDPSDLCFCCRFTEVIPDLGVPGNRELWGLIHTAQRRLLYSLRTLGLPLKNRHEDPVGGLAFRILGDTDKPAMTGHENGVITLALTEADDAERERRRLQMGEGYRTLLGHFRHEVGHYFWDRLVRDGGHLDAFRACFGDDRIDYAEALKRHHREGAPTDWSARFISAYATTHPWEDWAETWAHYLHLSDVLETAASCGLGLDPESGVHPRIRADAIPMTASQADFDTLIADWLPVSRMLNSLNRSLGLKDAYPFVLPDPVIGKLRFVHDLIRGAAAAPRA